MSKNALVLERTESAASLATHPPSFGEFPCSGEYLDLIRRLFQSHSVVAVVDSGGGSRGPEACRGIAAELAASGNRVVIVRVDALLRTSQLPDATACAPGPTPGISLWPSTVGAPVEFFPSSAPLPATGAWLGSLRRTFEAVLLDCPHLETAPAATAAVASIAAMADAAVLVIEAGRTTKQQIQRDQQQLQFRGVPLAGCILMRRR
jgi:Mrp family chromosome partitioning ATPase